MNGFNCGYNNCGMPQDTCSSFQDYDHCGNIKCVVDSICGMQCQRYCQFSCYAGPRLEHQETLDYRTDAHPNNTGQQSGRYSQNKTKLLMGLSELDEAGLYDDENVHNLHGERRRILDIGVGEDINRSQRSPSFKRGGSYEVPLECDQPLCEALDKLRNCHYPYHSWNVRRHDRSHSTPSRPTTRRNQTDMPEPVESPTRPRSREPESSTANTQRSARSEERKVYPFKIEKPPSRTIIIQKPQHIIGLPVKGPDVVRRNRKPSRPSQKPMPKSLKGVSKGSSKRTTKDVASAKGDEVNDSSDMLSSQKEADVDVNSLSVSTDGTQAAAHTEDEISSRAHRSSDRKVGGQESQDCGKCYSGVSECPPRHHRKCRDSHGSPTSDGHTADEFADRNENLDTKVNSDELTTYQSSYSRKGKSSYTTDEADRNIRNSSKSRRHRSGTSDTGDDSPSDHTDRVTKTTEATSVRNSRGGRKIRSGTSDTGEDSPSDHADRVTKTTEATSVRNSRGGRKIRSGTSDTGDDSPSDHVDRVTKATEGTSMRGSRGGRKTSEARIYPQPHETKDDSYKPSVVDHEYLQFSLRITEDIIRNDLYTNNEMRRVFNSHVEANRGRLDMEKMKSQIKDLCKELNIPYDDNIDRLSCHDDVNKAQDNIKDILCLRQQEHEEHAKCMCEGNLETSCMCSTHCPKLASSHPVNLDSSHSTKPCSSHPSKMNYRPSNCSTAHFNQTSLVELSTNREPELMSFDTFAGSEGQFEREFVASILTRTLDDILKSPGTSPENSDMTASNDEKQKLLTRTKSPAAVRSVSGSGRCVCTEENAAEECNGNCSIYQEANVSDVTNKLMVSSGKRSSKQRSGSVDATCCEDQQPNKKSASSRTFAPVNSTSRSRKCMCTDEEADEECDENYSICQGSTEDGVSDTLTASDVNRGNKQISSTADTWSEDQQQDNSALSPRKPGLDITCSSRQDVDDVTGDKKSSTRQARSDDQQPNKGRSPTTRSSGQGVDNDNVTDESKSGSRQARSEDQQPSKSVSSPRRAGSPFASRNQGLEDDDDDAGSKQGIKQPGNRKRSKIASKFYKINPNSNYLEDIQEDVSEKKSSKILKENPECCNEKCHFCSACDCNHQPRFSSRTRLDILGLSKREQAELKDKILRRNDLAEPLTTNQAISTNVLGLKSERAAYTQNLSFSQTGKDKPKTSKTPGYRKTQAPTRQTNDLAVATDNDIFTNTAAGSFTRETQTPRECGSQTLYRMSETPQHCPCCVCPDCRSRIDESMLGLTNKIYVKPAENNQNQIRDPLHCQSILDATSPAHVISDGLVDEMLLKASNLTENAPQIFSPNMSAANSILEETFMCMDICKTFPLGMISGVLPQRKDDRQNFVVLSGPTYVPTQVAHGVQPSTQIAIESNKYVAVVSQDVAKPASGILEQDTEERSRLRKDVSIDLEKREASLAITERMDKPPMTELSTATVPCTTRTCRHLSKDLEMADVNNLLLTDDYNNGLPVTALNYQNGLPPNISKFFPTISTQTYSSDFIFVDRILKMAKDSDKSPKGSSHYRTKPAQAETEFDVIVGNDDVETKTSKSKTKGKRRITRRRVSDLRRLIKPRNTHDSLPVVPAESAPAKSDESLKEEDETTDQQLQSISEMIDEENECKEVNVAEKDAVKQEGDDKENTDSGNEEEDIDDENDDDFVEEEGSGEMVFHSENEGKKEEVDPHMQEETRLISMSVSDDLAGSLDTLTDSRSDDVIEEKPETENAEEEAKTVTPNASNLYRPKGRSTLGESSSVPYTSSDDFMKKLDHKPNMSMTGSMVHSIKKVHRESQQFRHPEERRISWGTNRLKIRKLSEEPSDSDFGAIQEEHESAINIVAIADAKRVESNMTVESDVTTISGGGTFIS